jgi:hypothetical protein
MDLFERDSQPLARYGAARCSKVTHVEEHVTARARSTDESKAAGIVPLHHRPLFLPLMHCRRSRRRRPVRFIREAQFPALRFIGEA